MFARARSKRLRASVSMSSLRRKQHGLGDTAMEKLGYQNYFGARAQIAFAGKDVFPKLRNPS